MTSKMKERNAEVDVMGLTVKELQHEHPLTLVDLQLMHRDYIEDDDEYDDNDLITTQNFHCTCNRICGVELEDEHMIYKCSRCMYYVHPDCATQRIKPFMSIFLPDENVIGEGGYGIVYSGILADNTMVAVKNLLNNRLTYLHEGLEPKVVHRGGEVLNDVIYYICKYVATKYARMVTLNERSDVYSFGILIMEIISGRTL
ncbi:putative non-specific serine/threonine protein kinase [Helianthus annuus]|nr:putative non-specific serine/threonine protein kinase [Helianthus annuus]